MQKRMLFSLALACAGLFNFLIAQNADVAGDWELTMQTQRGESTRNMSIAQEEENLTVTMDALGGGEVSGTGTIKGNDIEWTITRETPRGELTMTYKGTVSGDTMSGEVQMRNRTIEWTAVKKQS